MSLITGKQIKLDGIAVAMSALCLVHCLLLPLLLILVPALTAFLAIPESFHRIALLFAIPTSILALAAGFRRHRSSLPIVIVAPGLALLAFGALGVEVPWQETLLTVAGALLLSLGHALNWRSLRP
jgi:hypothetical protein